MAHVLGLLRIRVKRGINLAIRDTHKGSSDPYVVITMGEQEFKTSVVKQNCNPEWNDELTLRVTETNNSVNLCVYDRDTFSMDDKMGDAEIEIGAYLECVKMLHYERSSNDDMVLQRVKPSRENCLAHESCILWKNGKIVQDMFLRLRNVECGEVEVQLEFIILHGSDGSGTFRVAMENLLGLLRIGVKRGINLAVRDTHKGSSDPYVIITMGEQKLKTYVVNQNCNPEWNDELTLCVTDPNLSINLTVYDKDTLTGDDKMGDAEIEIRPYLECCAKMLHRESSPNENAILWTVKPSKENCLTQESCIVWKNGKIVQDMLLRLRDVECGEVEVQIEVINLPSSDGQ